MEKKQDADIARLIPLLVVGIMLNTLSIVSTSLGDIRFLMMAAGLACMLIFIVKAIASRGKSGGPDAS